ncbi:MAG: DUF6036 family nucleotidyltransferase, partial [Halodesulfurarchaeum sp.]
MRDMFGTGYMKDELARIGEALDDETVVYLIGGGAMAFRDLKDATKDVDLVVLDEAAFLRFVEALEEMGYGVVEDPDEEYDVLGASAILENDDGCRFDIFHRQVVDKLIFSDGMADRSESLIEEGNLVVRMASPEDIFLFKSVAGRTTDLEDMTVLVQTGLDHDTVLDELHTQMELLDDRLFVTYVNETLIDLEDEYNVTTPI